MPVSLAPELSGCDLGFMTRYLPVIARSLADAGKRSSTDPTAH